MEFLTAIVGSIAGEIAKCTVAPIGRKIGYLVFYKRNINNLRTKLQELQDKKTQDVDRRINDAARNLLDPSSKVEAWQREVNVVHEESTNLLQRCFYNLCPNPKSLYSLSRKATKMCRRVDALLEEAGKFEDKDFTCPRPPPPLGSVVSQNVNVEEIQGNIASRLGWELKKDDKRKKCKIIFLNFTKCKKSLQQISSTSSILFHWVRLSNLQHLVINGCPLLKVAFSSSVVEQLVQLKTLEIWDCEQMEYIVASIGGEEDTITSRSVFPMLTSIQIYRCPKMKTLFAQTQSPSTSNQTVPLMKQIDFSNKIDMKNEFLATGSFEELKVLKVEIKSSVEIEFYIAKLNKLTELHLHGLQFEQLIWYKPLENLKRIYLSQNYSLIRISDLAKAPNLEVIVIHCCIRLGEIGSIRNLNKLTKLDIRGCTSISRISEIPGSIKELDLSNSGLWQIPRTIGYLTHLRKLSFEYCKSLESLPSSICSLISLETLNLSKCWSLRKLPYDFGNLEALEELDASYSGLREFPFSIQNLKNLKILNLSGCKELEFTPTDLLPNLRVVRS